ncbi:MAG: hypothetical protein EOO08_12320 [Chitinophagaceae bacterium]|nr:MAG: hypothetical protein EOO08_12320 [Chitinophagaceae bacterium]
MPISISHFDGSPLFNDYEIVILDEELLANYVAQVVLGFHLHIANILLSKAANAPKAPNRAIGMAIQTLSSADDEKRDGWIFQIISWTALNSQYAHAGIKAQQPQDAPAQHGIDGLAILMDETGRITNIIITEDKCTKHPRQKIQSQVWPEFKQYEKGTYDNKIVGRVTALLAGKLTPEGLDSIYNDIFKEELRTYRVGVNRDKRYVDRRARIKLFDDYDNCIPGDCSRRSSATLFKEDIRAWMKEFCAKVVSNLETMKGKSDV